MKQINRILIGLICVLPGYLLAQESGYFGKKIFIEVAGQVQVPVFRNILLDKGYVEKKGALHPSYYTKDAGFRLALGAMTSARRGVALEFVQRFYQVNPLRGSELNRQYTDSAGIAHTDYITPQVAFLNVQERMIMPKVIFSTKAGRVPAGVTHEIGVGYSMITVKKDNSMIGYPADHEYSASDIQKNLLDPRVEELKGITFMYGVRMNFPITKTMLFNIGVRYMYALLLERNDYRKMEQTESWLSGREIWSRVNQTRKLGMMNLGAGLVFCL